MAVNPGEVMKTGNAEGRNKTEQDRGHYQRNEREKFGMANRQKYPDLWPKIRIKKHAHVICKHYPRLVLCRPYGDMIKIIYFIAALIGETLP